MVLIIMYNKYNVYNEEEEENVMMKENNMCNSNINEK